MFAKFLGNGDDIQATDLEQLPLLETAKQIALLDRCLALSKTDEFQDRLGIGPAVSRLLAHLGSRKDTLSEAEQDVAARAMSLVQEPDQLADLLAHPCLALGAAKRLSKLLHLDAAHPANTHELVFQARLETASDTDIQLLAGKASKADELALLVIRASAETRSSLLKLPLLRGEHGLAVLEKVSRGRDKTCNRLAREGLEFIRDNRRILNDHLKRLAEIPESVQRELKIPPKDLDALIVQRKKLSQLKLRYEQLLTDIQAAERTLTNSGEVVEAFQPNAEPFAGLDLTVPDAQDNPFPPLLNTLSVTSDSLTTAEWLDEPALAAAETTLSQIAGDWRQACDVFPASENQQQLFDQRLSSLQKQLTGWRQLIAQPWDDLSPPNESGSERASIDAISQWLAKAEKAQASIHWPKDLAVPPKLAQLRQHIAGAADQKTSIAARQQALSAELKSLSGTIAPLIESGEFRRALSVLGQCRSLQKQGARGAEKTLNQASQQLGELSDWQQFAASPKREALLQSVQDLVEAPADPEVQREKLKDLRSQWNALGPLPKAQRNLQQSFDELAEQAFAVCKAHFAEQNKARRQNLQARKALCDHLQQYLDNTDWSAADMKAAEQIMRQARRQWQEHHPCDRKGLKPVEKRFEALQEALYSHVKNTWDANVKAKETLVSRAQALLEQESSDGLAAGAKDLQAQWRNIGTTPRSADQRLWKRFRKICDEIFDRLGNERTAHRTAQKQVETELTAQLNAFDPSNAGIADAEAQLNTLADRAQELGLERQFRKALNAKEQQLTARRNAQRQASQQKRLEEFMLWDQQVSEAEAAGNSIAAPHNLFNPRIAGTAASEDLHTLTMEAEIAADIPGPKDEQSARMTLQIQLMNQGMRNMQLVDNQQLLERWCQSGPKTPADDALRQRFFAALTARLN